MSSYFEKVQVGKDQEKAQSENPTPKTEVGKNQTNNQVLYHETYRNSYLPGLCVCN